MSIDRIKRLQRHLKLDADGIIGPATLSALENIAFGKQGSSENKALHSLTLSKKGFYQLINHEISSPAYYKRRLQKPVWPGGASGVTIGIGYDLGYHRDYHIRRDWSAFVSDSDLQKLIAVAGKKGAAAKAATAKLKNIRISYASAAQVFSDSTLPRYAQATKKTFKGIEHCVPDVQAAILSLVYNRGTRLSGSKRKEMKAIQGLIKQQDYAAIAKQILAMKRLWENTNLKGLLKRRDDEAKLVAKADDSYKWQELIRV